MDVEGIVVSEWKLICIGQQQRTNNLQLNTTEIPIRAHTQVGAKFKMLNQITHTSHMTNLITASGIDTEITARELLPQRTIPKWNTADAPMTPVMVWQTPEWPKQYPPIHDGLVVTVIIHSLTPHHHTHNSEWDCKPVWLYSDLCDSKSYLALASPIFLYNALNALWE